MNIEYAKEITLISFSDFFWIISQGVLWIASNSILLLSNNLFAIFQLYFPPSSHWWIFIFVSRHLINQYVSSGMCGILCPFFNSMICFMIEKNHIYTLWKSKYFNFICNIHRPYKLSIIMIKPSKFTMYWTQITPDTYTCHTKNYMCNIKENGSSSIYWHLIS